MPAYAVGHVYNVKLGADITEYLLRIDDTFAPFNGRWLVHDSRPQVIEGQWEGTLVIIEFPDLDHARRWYDSKAYQNILHLRTDVSDGVAVFAAGVDHGHSGADKVHEIAARQLPQQG